MRYGVVWVPFAKADQPGRNFPTDVYRVAVPFDCPGCAKALGVGVLVTMHKRGPGDPPVKKRVPLRPYCRACWPFHAYRSEYL